MVEERVDGDGEEACEGVEEVCCLVGGEGRGWCHSFSVCLLSVDVLR